MLSLNIKQVNRIKKTGTFFRILFFSLCRFDKYFIVALFVTKKYYESIDVVKKTEIIFRYVKVSDLRNRKLDDNYET